MDLAMIKLTIEGLVAKVTHLEKRNKKLSKRLAQMEREEKKENQPVSTTNVDDVLLDTSEVLKILGISYNTLSALVKRNLIPSIRINQRRIRYSKKAVYAYISAQSN